MTTQMIRAYLIDLVVILVVGYSIYVAFIDEKIKQKKTKKLISIEPKRKEIRDYYDLKHNDVIE